MARTVRLLGRPVILDEEGRDQAVRGHKSWALLARLLLSKRPIARQTLAGELFADADDPLGSLRWCLASLRGALAAPQSLGGDPISPDLPEGTVVDIWQIDEDGFDAEAAGTLLEGTDPRASPEFATWLLVERERMESLVSARLRQETMRAMAIGDHDRAVRLAEAGVRRAPFDEGAHVRLVKSLSLSGRHSVALRHVEATEAAFLAEMGEKPTAALRSAARASVASAPAGISGAVFVNTMIQSGLAALSAGATDAGIECLRRAVQDSASDDATPMRSRALFELGSALVHFVHGPTDEGALTLRQAAEMAQQVTNPGIAAASLRELGFIEFKAGRRLIAAELLAEALRLEPEEAERGSIYAVSGINLVHWGREREGLAELELAFEHALAAGNPRREIVALAYGAWGLLAAGRVVEAEERLTRCIRLVDEQRWMAFRPWPVALLAEAAVRQGREADALLPGLEEAFALSCQVGDPCWQAAAARAIGLAHAAREELPGALHWLADARQRCIRDPGVNVAIHVETLAEQSRISAVQGHDDLADAFGREWLTLAARTHMDCHVERAAAFVTGARG